MSINDKKSGLQKKISSIFQGMPNMEEPGASGPNPDVNPDAGESLGKRLKEEMERRRSEASAPAEPSPAPVPPPAPQPVPEQVPAAPPVVPVEVAAPQAPLPVPPAPEAGPPASNPSMEFLKQMRLAGSTVAPYHTYAQAGLKAGASGSSIGLDLGERQYKLIRMGKKKALEGLAFHEWAESSEFPTEPETKQEVLREMVEQVHGTKARTVLGIQGESVAYQILRLPVLSREEMAKAVRWELTKKGLLESGVPTLLDYTALRAKYSEKKALVLAVSVNEAYVTGHIQCAENAGLSVEQVDTTVQALEQIVREGRLFPEGDDGAVLEMGFGGSTLCFYRGTDLQYARVLGLGGKDFLTAITGSLRVDGQSITLSATDALLLQRVVGIPGDDMLKSSPARNLFSQLSARMRPVLEDVVSELRRSIEFYVSSSGLGPVSVLYLSGGIAGMNNLAAFLSKELGMTVKVLKPFDMLGISVPENLRGAMATAQPSFTLALGLALQKGHRLKLMPAQYRWKSVDRMVTRLIKVTAGATIAGILMVGGGLQAGLALLKNQLAAVEAQSKSIAEPVQQARKFEEILKGVRDKEKLIVGNALRQPVWEGVLKEISRAIPPNVVLTEISLVPQSVPKTLKLIGTIYADNLSVDSELGLFMRGMGASPYFFQFDLMSRKNILGSERPASAFDLRATLRY